MHYIKDIVSPEEASTLVSLCDARSGWVASPQKDPRKLEEQQGMLLDYVFQVLDMLFLTKLADDGSKIGIINDNRRTSYSCPLLWPLLYLSKIGMRTHNMYIAIIGFLSILRL